MGKTQCSAIRVAESENIIITIQYNYRRVVRQPSDLDNTETHIHGTHANSVQRRSRTHTQSFVQNNSQFTCSSRIAQTARCQMTRNVCSLPKQKDVSIGYVFKSNRITCAPPCVCVRATSMRYYRVPTLHGCAQQTTQKNIYTAVKSSARKKTLNLKLVK